MFDSAKQGFTARIRLQDCAFTNIELTVLTVHFVAECARKRAARFRATPKTIERAKNTAIDKAPNKAESIEQQFDALTRLFESLGCLDSRPGFWTEGGRLAQRTLGVQQAIESALDHGGHFIVMERPPSTPNRLLLALGIEAVSVRKMFYEARREIPTIIGTAMIKHYQRAKKYTPSSYEAFLERSQVEFLIPLFRSLLTDA